MKISNEEYEQLLLIAKKQFKNTHKNNTLTYKDALHTILENNFECNFEQLNALLKAAINKEIKKENLTINSYTNLDKANSFATDWLRNELKTKPNYKAKHCKRNIENRKQRIKTDLVYAKAYNKKCSHRQKLSRIAYPERNALRNKNRRENYKRQREQCIIFIQWLLNFISYYAIKV